MNKGFKRVLTISLILIFVGIALLVGSLIASKGDFKTISNSFEKLGIMTGNSSSVEKTITYDMTSELKNINLSFINSRIIITKSPDKKVHVSYETRKNYIYEENKSNDQLLINEKANWSFFNFDFGTTEVTVSIPEDSNVSDISLNVVNGSLTVKNINTAQLLLNGTNTSSTVTGVKMTTLRFGTVNGNLDMLDSSTKSLTFNNTNGSATLSNTSFTDAVMTTVNGSATLALIGKKDDYKVTFGVINGQLEVNNDTFKGSTTLNGSDPKSSISYNGTNASMILKTIE